MTQRIDIVYVYLQCIREHNTKLLSGALSFFFSEKREIRRTIGGKKEEGSLDRRLA